MMVCFLDQAMQYGNIVCSVVKPCFNDTEEIS